MRPDFQPVLIGSDNTVYGLARSFHMAYGKQSIVICRAVTKSISNSKIIKQIFTEPDLLNPEVFSKKLIKVANNWYKKHPNTRLLLVTPVSDSYAELLSKNQKNLQDKFDMNIPNWELYQKVTDKTNFYKLCEKHGLDYPQFMTVNPKSYQKAIPGFRFPVVIKPVDSSSYWLLPRFDGYQKVYFADNQSEVLRILELIYQNGYSNEMMIQEKIEADVFHQQDITTYSGKNTRQVQFSQLFQAVLADNNPLSFGVFCALLPTENLELESKVASFLDDIGYQGFAGLNIMIDPRDDKPKLLELNARLHGESYALTATGNNPAKILVNDIYCNKKTPKNQIQKLWRSVPNYTIRKFIMCGPLKNEVIDLIKRKQTDTDLYYKSDLSLIRHKDYLVFMIRRLVQFEKFASKLK